MRLSGQDEKDEEQFYNQLQILGEKYFDFLLAQFKVEKAFRDYLKYYSNGTERVDFVNRLTEGLSKKHLRTLRNRVIDLKKVLKKKQKEKDLKKKQEEKKYIDFLNRPSTLFNIGSVYSKEAESLGISTRTIHRWKKEGLNEQGRLDRVIQKRERIKKIERIANKKGIKKDSASRYYRRHKNKV